MKRAAIVTLVMMCVACSRGPSTADAAGVFQQTAANLSKIASGELFLRLENEVGASGRFGFEIAGPFSFASPGAVPVADVEYKLFDTNGEETARFVSNGQATYLVEAGRSIPMSQDQIAQTGLASLVRGSDGRSVLEDLEIARWVAGSPEIAHGGRIGGADTDKVTAQLDAAEMMAGLTTLSRRLGTNLPSGVTPPQGADAESLRQQTRDAQIELWSGKDDRILRKLTATFGFGPSERPLPGRLEEMSGVSVKLEATVTRLNEDISVELPR